MPVRIAKSNAQTDDRQLGMEALKTKQWLEAINRLGAVLEIDPADVEVMRSIATAHFALGDSKTARTVLGRAIQMAPDCADAHREMAILLLKEDRVMEAAENAIRAVEVAPHDDTCLSLLNTVRARVKELKPSSGMKGKKQSKAQGVSQSTIDACLSRINATLGHASSIRDGYANSSEKPTISLCMIAKDEEAYIGNCLKSVRNIVDDMVILDTGSSDRTVEIAESFGAQVYHADWPNSYAEARNHALSHATGDWILVLDADERLDQGSKASLLKAVKNPNAEAYAVSFRNYVTDDASVFVHRACRLFRNKPEYRYTGRVHERLDHTIVVSGGALLDLNVVVHHDGYRPEVMEQRGKHERYVNLLLQDLKDDPNDPYCLYNLGMAYSTNGNVQDAITYLRRAVELISAEHDFASAAYSRLAQSLCAAGEPKEALDVLRQAEGKGIRHPELHYSKGSALLKAERYGEAITAFGAAIRDGQKGVWSGDLGVSGHKSYHGAAQAFMGLEQYANAIEACKKALEQNPNGCEVHGLLGAAYLAVNHPHEAERHLTRAVGLNPGSPEAVIQLADALQQRKSYQEAIAKYSDVLSSGHESPEVRIKLGVSLQCIGDHAAAEKNYRRAIELKADYPQAYVALGLLYAEQDRLEESMQSFAQAVDVDPSYADSYFCAADVLYSAGKYVQSADVCQSGLSYDPSNAKAFLTLGNCYFRMAAHDAAIIAYRQALALKPGYPEAKMNLARAEEATVLALAA